jgi:hypothetical protein
MSTVNRTQDAHNRESLRPDDRDKILTLRAALGLFLEKLAQHGEWKADGYYYKDKLAPELQEAILSGDKAMEETGS